MTEYPETDVSGLCFVSPDIKVQKNGSIGINKFLSIALYLFAYPAAIWYNMREVKNFGNFVGYPTFRSYNNVG